MAKYESIQDEKKTVNFRLYFKVILRQNDHSIVELLGFTSGNAKGKDGSNKQNRPPPRIMIPINFRLLVTCV